MPAIYFSAPKPVMAGLVPAIHAPLPWKHSNIARFATAWVAGTSPDYDPGTAMAPISGVQHF
jgi:hypothetical protein